MCVCVGICIGGWRRARTCSFSEASRSSSAVAVADLLLTGGCSYAEAKELRQYCQLWDQSVRLSQTRLSPSGLEFIPFVTPFFCALLFDQLLKCDYTKPSNCCHVTYFLTVFTCRWLVNKSI